MPRFISLLLSYLFITLIIMSCGEENNPCTPSQSKNPVIAIETSLGIITIELYPQESPITVGNFLNYVYEGFYDSLIFHRAIPNFIIQGGGFDENLQKKPTRDPIPNEADNGLSNKRGTIGMARTHEIHSATSQFFINVVDNPQLDHKDDTFKGYGYAVFGKVIAGIAIVDSISMVETHSFYGYQDVPIQPVFTKIYRIK